jgi:hypothetical protein
MCTAGEGLGGDFGWTRGVGVLLGGPRRGLPGSAPGRSMRPVVQRTIAGPLGAADVPGHTLAPRITTRGSFNRFTSEAFFFVVI